MKIKTTRNFIIENVILANTFWTRFLGLMFKNPKKMPDGNALLLTRCAMIHTCFMRFNIDAFFLSKDFFVVGIRENMKPWSFSKYYKNAYYTLEAKSGFLNDKIKIGDKIEFIY